jgi:thiamine biosynthesis protein ThiS
MELTINGRAEDLPADMSVADVLGHFGVDAGRAVVELNREIIPRDRYGVTLVKAGDVIELVEVVGGG